MTEEKMLTVRDVATILGISEKDVLDLTEKGSLPGYKVGGVYLRFKHDQVQQYKKNQDLLAPGLTKVRSVGLGSRIHDFFYFNDFYIFALIFIILLGYLVYRGL
ncbi:MAG: helix-turn-helix domain-containing protein [Candidatus Omnitrophota bacterium]